MGQSKNFDLIWRRQEDISRLSVECHRYSPRSHVRAKSLQIKMVFRNFRRCRLPNFPKKSLSAFVFGIVEVSAANNPFETRAVSNAPLVNSICLPDIPASDRLLNMAIKPLLFFTPAVTKRLFSVIRLLRVVSFKS